MTVADTHAVLWLTLQPELLSASAGLALTDARSAGTLCVADITLHEIAQQVRRGRVEINASLHDYLQFLETSFTLLNITASIADRASQFGRAYPKDPADRLIGATAIVYHAKLVTKDTKIHASKEVECIW